MLRETAPAEHASVTTEDASDLIDQLVTRALAHSCGNIAEAEAIMKSWLAGDDTFAVLARESIIDRAIRRELRSHTAKNTRAAAPGTAAPERAAAHSEPSRSLLDGLRSVGMSGLMSFRLSDGNKKLAYATKVELIVESNLYLLHAKAQRTTGIWLRLVAGALRSNDTMAGSLEGGEVALKALMTKAEAIE